MPTSTDLTPALTDWVRELASSQDPRVTKATPVFPLLTKGLPTRPIAPEHSQVYICAGVIVKLHGTGTDAGRLARRLHCIGGPDMDRLWIQPLRHHPIPAPGDRLATIWPRVTVLSTIDRPPWVDVGRLLARLHRMPVRDDPPRLGGHSRLARAVSYLRGRSDLTWLADLGRELADRLEQPAQSTLAHGDFHLGQLGHTPLRRSWKLLDVDDFGVGDPAWDLARPAGFWAAGLLDDEAWTTFLAAYRESGGPAVPADGDPWPALDLPARAAVLVAAVQALRLPHSELTVEPLLAACRRMQTGSHDPTD
ncbi:MAG TPA: aminoglycoside phosphotransferase family protein [Propionicimonas sp.]|nr:aminoglycoside phosphotransferase family protein [Propionicimonas sp.]HRA06575.1 aminoglycoside phosphotransferase family protein [Propionicimonas sp.]